MTDVAIPPAREALLAAIRAVLEAVQDRDFYGQVHPQDDSEVIADAVLALLPTEADIKALTQLCHKLGKAEGRKEALKEVADGMGFESHSRNYVTVQLDLDTYGQLLAAREIATKDPT